MTTITSLTGLAELINANGDWSLTVSDIIAANGWEDTTGEEYGVCIDRKSAEQVVINESGNAEVVPYEE